MNVTVSELKKMERFYLKKLFGGIPAIDIEFKAPKCRGGAIGLFSMDMNDDYYCLGDELYFEYDGYVDLGDAYGFGVGYCEKDLPWMDVLNHPKLKIQLAPRLKKDREGLVLTLLHELCHYYCWYTGLDYHDEDGQFLDELKRLGVPSNYDFKRVNKEWVRPEYFSDSAKRYIEMYERGIAA